MSCTDPTGAKRADTPNVPPAQAKFLRQAIGDCKAGFDDDLARHPDDPNAEEWREDAVACERLLGVLDAPAEMAVDEPVIRTLCRIATAIDSGNEHERAAFEHNALMFFAEQLDGARAVLACRGLADPGHRVALCDLLADAAQALAHAAERLADALAGTLEGTRPSDDDLGDFFDALKSARERFNDAVAAAGDFLWGDDGLAEEERKAREEVAAVARQHVVSLPSRSKLRTGLIQISALDQQERVAAYEKRIADSEGQVV